MGMSTHVVGFRPPDERWNAMKAIWESCETAGVHIPEDVEKFFGHESPSNRPGAEVELGEALTDYSEDSCDGYELDITKLPKDVRIVRFYNSY